MNLEDRRTHTSETIDKIRQELTNTCALLKGKACIYATGSFGRGEASKNSDLDLFIAARCDTREDSAGLQSLNGLDEICVKADLINAIRTLELPEFDGEGEYLKQYTSYDLRKNLGTPADDGQNTFTARLLLLLESTPILEEEIYNQIIDNVIGLYWQDYPDHSSQFKPMFLANDIQRLWRTLCVSYESKRLPGNDQSEERLAKARVKNYKLKYSRVLTCYSAILSLLDRYEKNKTVSPQDARDIVKMTPMERIEELIGTRQFSIFGKIKSSYEEFLSISSVTNDELATTLSDKRKRDEHFESANQFGLHIAEAMRATGEETELFKRLIV